jgi:hypothetical protein
LEKLAIVPDGAVLKVFAVGPASGSIAVAVGSAVDDFTRQLVDDDVRRVEGKS